MKITIMEALKKTVKQFPGKTALKTKVKGRWQEISWEEYYNQIRTTARAFMALGLEKGESINILGNNCPKWFISNLAGIFAGSSPCGIYTTNSSEQCLYIAEHSKAKIVVVENAEQLAKFKKIKDQLPELKAIVMMTGSDDGEGIYLWEQLPKIAEKVSEDELNKRITAQDPDDCCTIIYTSGSTGDPKGVMISHDNIIWTASQTSKTIEAGPDEHFISYLPLSHIAEQVISLYLPIINGCTAWFAESLDLLGSNILEVRPTMFAGVPRVWEKFQAKITSAGMQNSGLKKKISAWARKQGLAGGYAEQEAKPKPLLYGLANKLVFSKVREKLGFDRCRLFISTAAPISVDTLEFFLSLGIPVTEVYGMSECTGPTTMSLPYPLKYRTGWAGPVIPGAELSVAEDGEVLMRGRHVFKGYFKNEEATKKAIDKDGWLHSEDIGKIDDKGFLKIVDRKKELIITAGGENISPQFLEGKLKSIQIISQAVVIGDRQKYLTSLLTLDPEKIEQEIKAAGSPAKDSETAAKCEKFRAYLQKQVDQVNSEVSRVQAIKKFVILPKEFSIQGEELTPTMKLKRRVIYKKYAKEIENMYRSD